MVGGNNEMSIAPQPESYNLLDSIKLPISKVVAVLAFCNLPREFQDAYLTKWNNLVTQEVTGRIRR
jgi:hypothetical protein